MKARQTPNAEMNAQAMNNTLPDGRYLTSPKWGYSEREVIIEGGNVSLVSDGKYIFSQYGFFEVNDVLKSLPL
jgi:hypothetical protein